MSPEEYTTRDQQWHLDKRVPVALIIALLGQLFIGGWFISAIVQDVEGNKAAISRLNTQQDIARIASQQQAVQLGRIEEQVTGLRADIGRMLTLIERNSE